MREYCVNVTSWLFNLIKFQATKAPASQIAGHNGPELPIANHTREKHASMIEERNRIEHLKQKLALGLILNTAKESPRDRVRQCHDHKRARYEYERNGEAPLLAYRLEYGARFDHVLGPMFGETLENEQHVEEKHDGAWNHAVKHHVNLVPQRRQPKRSGVRVAVNTRILNSKSQIGLIAIRSSILSRGRIVVSV
jgi:hypothetical protein